MEFGAAIELGRNAFFLAIMASAPILGIGLIVGLLISLFQAVTQLQEQTLTFAPKIVAMVVAASVFIPWIANRMIDYARQMLGSTPW